MPGDPLIDEAVRGFRDFLAVSWKAVECAAALLSNPIYTEKEAFFDDWLQANWELLVEGVVPAEKGVFLNIYGNGADCNGASSRVLFPERLPTHSVVVKSVYGERNGLPNALTGETFEIAPSGLLFGEFVAVIDGFPLRALPFDHVKLEDHDVALPIDVVEFGLAKFDDASDA